MKHSSKPICRLLMLLLAAVLAVSLVACNKTPVETPDDGDTPTPPAYDVITIAKALELCGDAGNITEELYYIRGTVKTVSNSEFGSMVIEDATGSISVYGTYGQNDEKFCDLAEKPAKGDEVLLHCVLQNYNGTKEVKKAILVEFTSNQGKVDVSDYTAATVAEARAAVEGTKLKVSGVVASITYANGMKPSGVMLVDSTGSIYVYDGDLAGSVSVGNKIEIAASKTYWILDTEKNNAAAFGYRGCNQLEDVTLVSNDKKTDNVYDKTAITEATVKELLDTPVSEDITTKIFKVTAMVRKVPGNGFVNYYFNDLDDATGAYVYTQCNGGDFDWLDAFDGKICTVYLTLLNAKSTASACFFRLLPITVIDEGFTFDLNDAPEHVVKYYGVGQFAESYSGNPQLELVTSVTSQLLGFSNATLSYTSSNTDVVTFTQNGDKLVMECLANGQAQVTVTGTYNGKTYQESVTVTVTLPLDIDFIGVGEAIAAAKGTEVVVKGIVGPSLVNQSGFYLIDESGAIAVLVADSVLANVELGQEIILKGTRSVKDKSGVSCFGQSHLSNCEVLVNNYGKHNYATDSFITGKTVAEFYALDATVDYSTSVFVLTATVKFTGSQFSSTVTLQSGNDSISLYCSNAASQYKFLQAFEGQEVTLEVAACNWNGKTYYRGCVLAVITEEGKVCNTLNFDK